MNKKADKSKKVFLIEVIPIARGIGKETLTYFTSELVEVGSLIDISMRNRKIKGIVIKHQDAHSMKSSIKAADFSLKKIDAISSKQFLNPEFMNTAEKTAQFFAGTTGAVLNSLIPKPLFETLEIIAAAQKSKGTKKRADTKDVAPLVLQANFDQRIEAYTSIISSQHTEQKSVFIMIPSRESALRVENVLREKIQSEIILLHSSLSKKNLLKQAASVLEQKKPVVIIATGSFLCIPRHDISTLIIENESSRAYKSLVRPYIDFRVCAEIFSRTAGLQLVLGDDLVRMETMEKSKSTLTFPHIDHMRVINMKLSKDLLDKLPKDKRFKVVSEGLEQMIKAAEEKNETVFLFASRKGMSSTILCKDCGQTVQCFSCSAPVVLYKSKNAEANFFLCHHCNEKRSAHECCKKCGSWKLEAFGIGTERIQEEIQKKFPRMQLFLLDRSVAKTAAQARDIIKKFESIEDRTHGSVLIGTKMALQFLHRPIDHTSIVSIDSLFTIPDFRINEKVLRIIFSLSRISQKTFIVQTRNIEQEVIHYALNNNVEKFFKAELEQRSRFGYPPFKQLIKISLKGKKDIVSEQLQRVKNFLSQYNPFVFPALISTVKNEYVMHCILKIDQKIWPEPTLLEKLLSLPPSITIQVDPDSIL